MKTPYSSSFLAAALLAADASAQRIAPGKPRRLRNLDEFVTGGFDSSMSISMAAVSVDPDGLPYGLNSGNPAGSGGSGSKSGKATLAPTPTPDPSACSDILEAFNTIFSEERCGLTRTVGNGEVLLLARESKNAVIQEVCAAEPTCIDELDGLVDDATSVGGCNEPASGQPSGALTQYEQAQSDVSTITKFFCKEPTECNKVVEGLTNRTACWSKDNPLVPVLTDDCIADATCNCLTEYAIATNELSDEGRDTFGANIQTLGLVKARFEALDCQPLLGGGESFGSNVNDWGASWAIVPVRVIFNGRTTVYNWYAFDSFRTLKGLILAQRGILEADYADYDLYYGQTQLSTEQIWNYYSSVDSLTVIPSPKVS